mgnify:CR=1 FL=1|tara:strand:+ start:89 stop:1750 length:1662 start_codon:yes stop_codon:yes gene_type:complete
MLYKPLIFISIFLSFTFSQTYGGRTINTDTILSDTRVFNLLSDDAKEFINQNVASIEETFNGLIDISSMKYLEKYDCYSTYDKDRYASILLTLNNPTQYDADFVKSQISYTKCKSREINGFQVPVEYYYDSNGKQKARKSKLEMTKKLNTTWNDYLKYHGNGKIDYNIVAEKGLKKSDLKKYKLKAELRFNGSFIKDESGKYSFQYYWKDQNGDTPSQEVLDYYGLESSSVSVQGDVSVEKVNFYHIYRMDKYSKRESTKYEGPKIVFKSDDGEIKVTYPIWKFNDYAKKAENYASTIKMIVDEARSNYKLTMISDQVTIDYLKHFEKETFSLLYQYFRKPFNDDIETVASFYEYLFEVASLKESSSQSMIDEMNKKVASNKSLKSKIEKSEKIYGYVDKDGHLSLKNKSGKETVREIDEEILINKVYYELLKNLDDNGNFNKQNFTAMLSLYNKYYYDARSSEYDSEEFSNFWFNRSDYIVTLSVTRETWNRREFRESLKISNLFEENWKYIFYTDDWRRVNGREYTLERLANDTTNKYIKDIHKKVIYSKL